MYPIVFSAYGFGLPSYVAALSLAFIVGLATVMVLRRLYDPGMRLTAFVGVPVFLCSLVGARLFWILQYDSIVSAWRSFLFWQGGWVFYGGFIGGLVGAVSYFRLAKTHVFSGLDLLAPGLALGIVIARLGCFLNGCCWGEITKAPWAVRFPMKLTPIVLSQYRQGLLLPGSLSTLPVHPFQLYDALLNLVLFGVCLLVLRRRKYEGQVFLYFLIVYGLFRFLTEFFRGDTSHSFFGMTLSQSISLIVFLGSTATGTVVTWKRKA